ncbi:unnamed protein product [Linum trigynum]
MALRAKLDREATTEKLRLESLKHPEASWKKVEARANPIYEKQRQIFGVGESEKYHPESYKGSTEEAWNMKEARGMEVQMENTVDKNAQERRDKEKEEREARRDKVDGDETGMGGMDKNEMEESNLLNFNMGTVSTAQIRSRPKRWNRQTPKQETGA